MLIRVPNSPINSSHILVSYGYFENENKKTRKTICLTERQTVLFIDDSVQRNSFSINFISSHTYTYERSTHICNSLYFHRFVKDIVSYSRIQFFIMCTWSYWHGTHQGAKDWCLTSIESSLGTYRQLICLYLELCSQKFNDIASMLQWLRIYKTG